MSDQPKTRFWCPWCGATAQGATRDDRIQCTRCITEFARLFRFWPDAWMVPLADGEEAGVPEAARKRFTFLTPEGALLGRTWAPKDEDVRPARGGAEL